MKQPIVLVTPPHVVEAIKRKFQRANVPGVLLIDEFTVFADPAVHEAIHAFVLRRPK